MTELVTTEQVVHPITGELLAPDSPPETLAGFLAQVREYELELRAAKKLVTRWVLDVMDRRASWTLRAEGFTLTGQSPAPAESFDELALREDLLRLVDEDVLSVEAVDAAVETVVTFKVRRAGLSALRKLGGRVAETVDLHARLDEPTRYVSVKQAEGRS